MVLHGPGPAFFDLAPGRYEESMFSMHWSWLQRPPVPTQLSKNPGTEPLFITFPKIQHERSQDWNNAEVGAASVANAQSDAQVDLFEKPWVGVVLKKIRTTMKHVWNILKHLFRNMKFDEICWFSFCFGYFD